MALPSCRWPDGRALEVVAGDDAYLLEASDGGGRRLIARLADWRAADFRLCACGGDAAVLGPANGGPAPLTIFRGLWGGAPTFEWASVPDVGEFFVDGAAGAVWWASGGRAGVVDAAALRGTALPLADGEAARIVEEHQVLRIDRPEENSAAWLPMRLAGGAPLDPAAAGRAEVCGSLAGAPGAGIVFALALRPAGDAEAPMTVYRWRADGSRAVARSRPPPAGRRVRLVAIPDRACAPCECEPRCEEIAVLYE